MSPSAQTPLVRLAVLGAGAWGSVLASLAARNGHDVTLYSASEERAEAWRVTRRDPSGRTPLELPARVRPTANLNEALADVDGVLFAVPNARLHGLLDAIADTDAAIPLAVSCSKGLFAPALTRPSSVIASRTGAPVVVLSGPNLAGEIAAGLPAAATVAHEQEARAATVQGWLSSRTFRVYRDDDAVGVEIAGATKNVVALAAGMADALDLGENAKAALVTRGLAEMIRLGEHLGGRARTFYGLSGVGDLIATSTSRASRNHAAGERLATGESADALLGEGLTAEGIATARAMDAFAQTHELRLPITRQVAAVTRGERTAAEALDALLAGDPKTEWTATPG